jgi:hypothetical protein
MKRNKKREAFIETMRRVGGDEAVELWFGSANPPGAPPTEQQIAEREKTIKAEADAFWAGSTPASSPTQSTSAASAGRSGWGRDDHRAVRRHRRLPAFRGGQPAVLLKGGHSLGAAGGRPQYAHDPDDNVRLHHDQLLADQRAERQRRAHLPALGPQGGMTMETTAESIMRPARIHWMFSFITGLRDYEDEQLYALWERAFDAESPSGARQAWAEFYKRTAPLTAPAAFIQDAYLSQFHLVALLDPIEERKRWVED